jgi:hypothetical protein
MPLALALGAENPTREVMRQPPRSPEVRLGKVCR